MKTLFLAFLFILSFACIGQTQKKEPLMLPRDTIHGTLRNMISDTIKHIYVDTVAYQDTSLLNRLYIDTLEHSTVNKLLLFKRFLFDHFTFSLQSDTINGDICFSDSISPDPAKKIRDKSKLLFNSEDTYLNGAIIIGKICESQAVRFNNCQFGNLVRKIVIKADTVYFMNCDFLDANTTLDISPITDDRKVFVEFYRTDISNIRFTYPERMELFFSRESNPEINETVYGKIMSKFKIEGKDESYEHIDVNYRWWKTSHGTRSSRYWNKVKYFFGRAWYNFGYSNWQIIVWTIVFLLIFSIANFRKWDIISQTYPIDTITNRYIAEIESDRPKRNFYCYVLILLYTALIFFSLNLDFKNFRVIKLRYAFFFMLQYFVGIFCILYISKSILNIAGAG